MFGRPPCSASTAVEIHGLSMFSVPYHFDPGLDSCGILGKRKQMRVFVCIRAWAPHTKSRSMKSMKFILPRTIPCSLWIHPTSQHVLSWDQGFNCRRPLSHWKYPFWQFSAVRGPFNPRWCDVSVAWLVHLHSLARFWTLQQLLPMYDNIATRLVYLLDHKMRPTETKEASPEQALGAKEPTVGQQGNKHRTGKEPIELHISVCFQWTNTLPSKRLEDVACGEVELNNNLSVVPHKPVAEVSKKGNYRRGELLWCMDGRANWWAER